MGVAQGWLEESEARRAATTCSLRAPRIAQDARPSHMFGAHAATFRNLLDCSTARVEAPACWETVSCE
eukprot:4429392-Alexandrium_andersonii.AAC.1